MTGIDEESALLKKVRAHLCVKRKKLTDKINLSADEVDYLTNRAYFAKAQYAFVEAIN